ncbi:hypothetical protein EON64_01955 [archaeon]|nr:MAG: hypothetical protein EON64_01955 [archaeon]
MADIKDIIQKHLIGVDDDTLEYFESMITSGSVKDQELRETLAPFIESYGLAASSEEADDLSAKIVNEMRDAGILGDKPEENDSSPRLLEKSVLLANALDSMMSAEDRANVEAMWGLENVRKKRNEVRAAPEMSEAGSAKYERKAAKEQRKWLEELEAQFVGEEDNNNVSTMMLPDFSGNSNEKDIHVHNFNITYGGNLLLENADLRLVYGRRYGLIGNHHIILNSLYIFTYARRLDMQEH